MNVVVVGSGGHAKVVIDIIEREGTYNITGLIDDNRPVGEHTFGYKVIGKVTDIPSLCRSLDMNAGIIAIGNNWVRSKVAGTINDLVQNFIFIKAIHPSAQVGRGVVIGQGTVVMAGVAINSDTRVGSFCILNTRASLDHDCQMEDFSSLAPGATTGGNVCVGTFSAICLGANILQGKRIGPYTIIGAGALVVHDMPDHCLAYGIPARVIRKREEAEN